MLEPFLGLEVVTGVVWVTFSNVVVAAGVTVLPYSGADSVDVVVEASRETGISVASRACSVGQSLPPTPHVGPVKGETERLPAPEATV